MFGFQIKILSQLVCSTQSVVFQKRTNRVNCSQQQIIISVFLNFCSAQSNETRLAFSVAPPLRTQPVKSCQNETAWSSEAPGAPCGLPVSWMIIIRPSVGHTGCHEDQPPAGTLVVMPLMACEHIFALEYMEPSGQDATAPAPSVWLVVFSCRRRCTSDVHYQHLRMSAVI